MKLGFYKYKYQNITNLNSEAEQYLHYYSKIPHNYKDSTFKSNFELDSKLSLENHVKDIHSLSKTPIMFDSLKSDVWVEKPGIFIGRGVHPLRGKIKVQIMPINVTVNTVYVNQNENWKKIYNSNKITWAAKFICPVTNKIKYIFPPPSNSAGEKRKFIEVQKFNKEYKTVMGKIYKDLQSDSQKTKECSIAASIIDLTSIRAGNATKENMCDTFGCCSLKKKHVKIIGVTLNLSFIGKDSIKYERTIRLKEELLKPLKSLINSRNKSNDNVFTVSVNSLNEYLRKKNKYLTAKVFRTLHANRLLQKQLKSCKIKCPLERFFKGNQEVAKLCNHVTGDKYSCETSKTNYIDPRVVVAYCKQNGICSSKIYNKSQLEKHSWALSTAKTFKYENCKL